MMINEFVDLTGFKPTDDYYHTEIEPIYERSDMDKRDWCKQWKKNGGIQKAYDALKEQAANEYANVLSLENEVKNLRERVSRLNELNNNQSQVIRDEREKSFELSTWKEELMPKLIEISETYSARELRDLIIETIGFKAYISYKLEHDKAIWKIDREQIIENLK